MLRDEQAEMDFMIGQDYALKGVDTGKTIVADNNGKLFVLDKRMMDGMSFTFVSPYPSKLECHPAKGHDEHKLIHG